MAPRRRAPERGRLLPRFSLVLVGAVVVVTIVLAVRATAAPDLGPGPRGPATGPDEPAIGVGLAARLVPALVLQPTAQVTLSEQDLTVIVRATNPDPERFRDPQARVRDGLVVVAGGSDLGPLHVTAVGRFAVSLVEDPDGQPDIAATLREADAGQLTLPGFIRDRLSAQVEHTAGIGRVLASAPALARLRPFLDCVAVTADGLVLGFHRPGAVAAPGGCG